MTPMVRMLVLSAVSPASSQRWRPDDKSDRVPHPYMATCRPEGASESDLSGPLEHRDHHHVRDPDPADEQRDRPQAQQRRRERIVGDRFGLPNNPATPFCSRASSSPTGSKPS